MNQPEALRLADLLDERPHDALDFLPAKAAAELRRLHQDAAIRGAAMVLHVLEQSPRRHQGGGRRRNMTPTNRLRWVERKVPLHTFYRTVDPDGKMQEGAHTIRVLQQWWVPHYPGSAMDGEWRDVPLGVEE